MEASIGNTEKTKDVVLQYIVEQFGEKVRELADQIDSSFAKVRFKGEKDEIATFLEHSHYHPMATTTFGLETGVQYLQMLVHSKLMKELFVPNAEHINFLYMTKEDHTYIISLNDNSFDQRDRFRNLLFDLHDCKPYNKFVYVNLEFLPDDVLEKDLIQDKVVKLNLPEED